MNGLALCSGVDGIGLGLSLVDEDYETVCHVEKGAEGASVLVGQMQEGNLAQAPVWSKLETFRGERWRGYVDIVHAGFPCQPWSNTGHRKGIKDPRWLWPHIARIIYEVRPALVFIENTRGLVKGGLEPILYDLAAQRFDVQWDLFKACQVGSPQERERIYVLAYLHGAGTGLLDRLYEAWEESSRRREADEGSDDPGGEIVEDAAVIGGRTESGGKGEKKAVHTNPGACPYEQLGLYPPCLGDIEAWREAPLEDQPALQGETYGLANWLERIQLTGDGVVPQAVAHAFITLARRVVKR